MFSVLPPVNGVEDQFNAISYSGNDGVQNWTGDWVELEVDGPTAGDVMVVTNSRCTSGNCLNIHPRTNKGAYREVDLTGASTATLSFDWNFKEPEDNIMSVQASTDGISYNEVFRIEYSGSTTQTGNESIDVSSYISSTVYIKFEFITVYYSGTTTDMFFDNISVAHDGIYAVVNEICNNAVDDDGDGDIDCADSECCCVQVPTLSKN